MDIAIIDYKMSNLHSVKAACNKVGLSSVITSDSSQILDSKVAILPGVGAFGEAMSHLAKLKLDNCIYKYLETGRPFIGICLGLQLLFDTSQEFGKNSGLGIIKGLVKKFQVSTKNSIRHPVPQISWNRIQKNNYPWGNTLLSNNKNNDFMYFVHSYYVELKDDSYALTKTIYGDTEYCSSIQCKNIFATQFHPEKSGQKGLKIYQQLKKKISE